MTSPRSRCVATSLLGSLLLAAALAPACGTLPIAKEYDAERLINLPFETTWNAALKVASRRRGTIREMKSQRTIQIDSDVDVEILLESISRSETRIYVRAIEAMGLKRDAETSRWVADDIYRQATQ